MLIISEFLKKSLEDYLLKILAKLIEVPLNEVWKKLMEKLLELLKRKLHHASKRERSSVSVIAKSKNYGDPIQKMCLRGPWVENGQFLPTVLYGISNQWYNFGGNSCKVLYRNS